MGVKDISRNEENWQKLKENNYDLDNLNPPNKALVADFLTDFELGINTPPKSKGARKPGTPLQYVLESKGKTFQDTEVIQTIAA